MSHQRHRRRITCEKRGSKRLLCSDLVRVSWTEEGALRCEVAVLENLSQAGAGLFAGVPLPEQAPIEIASKRGTLRGNVKRCQYRENGYLIGVDLDAGSRWAQQPGCGFLPDQLLPEHLIDIALLDLD